MTAVEELRSIEEWLADKHNKMVSAFGFGSQSDTQWYPVFQQELEDRLASIRSTLREEASHASDQD